jgi:hypothetical protein
LQGTLNSVPCSGVEPALGDSLADVSAHTKLIVRELLPRAKNFVAESEGRLAAQEARVADLQRKGLDAPQSRKLLAVMRETMALQISHVKLLEREVRADPGFEQA